jgi:FtsZ-binding cell division protein ZapB
MESILKIIGTEIWIGPFLFSSGLEGPAYAAKLREAEELEAAVRSAIEAEDIYLAQDEIGRLACEIANLKEDAYFQAEERAVDSQQIESLQHEVDYLKSILDINGVEIPEDFFTSAPEPPPQSAT